MNAKEEHARNLEIHKMSRNNNEMAKKNIALEAECVKLRLNMKETTEKYATFMKHHNEKIEEMQRQFELEKERLNEQAKKKQACSVRIILIQ